MKKLNYFLFLFFACSQVFFSQENKGETFGEIRNHYEKLSIDDEHAVPFVKVYIQKAKNENKSSKLLQGYRDGRQFDYENKIQYADSALAISLKSGNKEEISKDYLSKGIIYYFYQKNYKLALDQYLKAFEYSKKSKNKYQHYKVLYHLGIVKEHLGYYEEALEHFENCEAFYGSMRKQKLHENELYNYNKAYYNSLHQMTVVNRYLSRFSKSDSLALLGYKLTQGEKDFNLENSYFLKCMGISKYMHQDFDDAKEDLQRALPVILKRNDLAWASVIYYYLGKIGEVQKDQKKAIYFYNKIDSIFQKQSFIFPEISGGYQFLINYYKNKDVHKHLYYTHQLLKADSLLIKDYPYLSLKIHKDYDRNKLIEQREDLEKISTKKIRLSQTLILIGAVIIIFFFIRYSKDRKIKKQYQLLQKRIAEGKYRISESKQYEVSEDSSRKTFLSPEITKDIEEKLDVFERELQFKKKGLTQKSIAHKLGTNSHYLSVYINENKGMNFNKYMAELRITYITNLLNTNNKYLNYTIEALAEECGIAARQNFSNLFFDINGIRPTDYIKKRKQELGIS